MLSNTSPTTASSISSESFMTKDKEDSNSITVYPFEASNHSESKFKLWEKLLHPKFGIGTVIKIEGNGDNVKLTMDFGTTKKVFAEKYAPLEKAD
jgi:DNA helicase-2/ATP-dependent DNA helicase PcrA